MADLSSTLPHSGVAAPLESDHPVAAGPYQPKARGVRLRRSVLVTDGEQRAAVAVVRSLGAAGYSVRVASTSGRSIAGASRYAVSETRVSDALTAPRAFAVDIRRLALECGADTVLPVTEAAHLALLPTRGDLGDIIVPASRLGVLRRACDKAHVLDLACRLGMATPAQEIAQDADEARAIAGRATLSYPVVVKPSRSVAEHKGRRMKVGVSYASTEAELRARIDELPAGAYPLLIQQRVEGPGLGIFLLRWQGRTIATFSHRRLREKPPSGGVSVYAESIAADPVLVRHSERLLDALEFDGVAMVEFKTHLATGAAYLMEVNPRFWGSLQLAVNAGVDFPRLLCEVAVGEHPEPVTAYRVGVRSRWWWGDVDHLLTRFRHSSSELALPPNTPSRWRALRDFARWHPGDDNDTLCAHDAGPFMRETAQWFSRR